MIRVIIASTQSELLRNLKQDLSSRSHIDSVLEVKRVIDANAKATRSTVLVIDLDSIYDLSRLYELKNKHGVFVLCVSASGLSAPTALRAGADEFVLKPGLITTQTSLKFFDEVVEKMAVFAKRQKTPAMRELVKMVTRYDRQKILVIASSTGGTHALEALFKELPADIPPTLVVQHMTSGFTKLFAERLDSSCKQMIVEANTGDYLMRGKVLMAPADRHMRLVQRDGRLAVECFVGDKIHGVMPAADILFESVAEIVKDNAVGVILTGMGADGARGLKRMRDAGAQTIGQDEATCVVYGMPKVAKDLGAVVHELPLDRIAEKMLSLAR